MLTIFAICRDAEIQRRQLEDSRASARRSKERLRQIELDIDDASRVLRRARTRVRLAREQLEELQSRHWAVLGFYDPNRAGEKVEEALREYGLSEKAPVNMDDDSMRSATGTSDSAPKTSDSHSTPVAPTDAPPDSAP